VSVRQRYFVAKPGSPAYTRILEISDQRHAARGAIKAFLDETGASQMYGTNPASYLFDFKSEPDREVWSKTKPHRGEYYFRPRRNTPAGKAMAERIKSLPECPSWNEAVAAVPGLEFQFPIVSDGNVGYRPHLRYWSHKAEVMIVQVPWRDYPQDEIDAYAKDRAAGTHFSASLDFAMWQPPEWMTEIKEWEALKLIDDSQDDPA
jgi:hypothetical protein